MKKSRSTSGKGLMTHSLVARQSCLSRFARGSLSPLRFETESPFRQCCEISPLSYTSSFMTPLPSCTNTTGRNDGFDQRHDSINLSSLSNLSHLSQLAALPNFMRLSKFTPLSRLPCPRAAEGCGEQANYIARSEATQGSPFRAQRRWAALAI